MPDALDADAVEQQEIAIDKEHDAAIKDLDTAIEQEASHELGKIIQKETDLKPAKSESQKRVEALEDALAAADKQNKALEAALAAADEKTVAALGPDRQGKVPYVDLPDKTFDVVEESGEVAQHHRRLRASSTSDANIQDLRQDEIVAPIQGYLLSSGKTEEKMMDEDDETLEESADEDSEFSEDATDPDELASNSSAVEVKESTMEKTLTDLILGSKHSGTPFGKSVRHIAKLIKKSMIPQIKKAHEANQRHLDKLANDMRQCGRSKAVLIGNADKSKAQYLKMSALHKSCRAAEAAKATEKSECFKDIKDKKRIKDLKCRAFGMNAKKYGDQQANRQIVKKGGSESTDSYITRITSTFCGKYPPAGLGGAGTGGFLDNYLKAKEECVREAKKFNGHDNECARIAKEYNAKKSECDSIQDQMDGAACKRATDVKDACESYAGCYFEKKKALIASMEMVKIEEKDRKAEWRGLKRMQCLVKAFKDGEVYKSEFRRCKKRKYSIEHLVVDYPKIPDMDSCSVPKLYPTTAAYKLAEFAPLPALAKGRKESFECAGVMEISTTPRKGSPATCKCERVTLNGPYSAGPLIKCTNCTDTRRSIDANSCPDGTKIFSPRSARDWKTVLSSVGELEEPYFIVDVTRPQNGCGKCTKKAMHSGRGGQPDEWRTSDGSPWWLRGKPYTQPNGNYHANCYLAMFRPWDAKLLKFDDDNCKFHAKSYYCQLETVITTPKKGSPASCKCEPVVLTGPYSAGALIKCTNCLRVRKATQKNSCPAGTKLFSPASKADWKTFISSARPLRSPNWIIDITRPQNGCGGCVKSAMNFGEPAQRTWRTADGSPWWLRSTKYSEPNGDYVANCYMDLGSSIVSENAVKFNDGRCKYHSNSYYCQTVKKRKKR